MQIPEQGKPREALLAEMEALHGSDADWRHGRTFSLMYNAGDEVTDLLDEAYRIYLHSNALSLTAFPSLRRFEAEVLSMAASLLHGDQAAGAVTSGGTESICMSIKTARDWARKHRPDIREPEMIVADSAHPAFHKAAHYFGVKAVVTPLAADTRADVDAMREAITDRTILLVGSAPCFPTGVVDPIEDIAGLAQERGLLCHVDACVGGYLLPWVERLGYPVPRWDFRVPGVTQISADLHKYGFAAKGASTVLYRDRKLRKHQFFAYVDWPGGIYASPSLAGARGGGPLAAAWAVMKFLGQEGFMRLCRDAMDTTHRFLDGIGAIDGLEVLGEPVATLFAYTHRKGDIYALGDRLEQRGWHVDRQQRPAALHQMISPYHKHIADAFLADLRAAAAEVVGQPPANTGMAAIYGMLTTMPDRGSVKDVVLDLLDSFDKV